VFCQKTDKFGDERVLKNAKWMDLQKIKKSPIMPPELAAIGTLLVAGGGGVLLRISDERRPQSRGVT